MKIIKQHVGLKQRIIALALLAAFGRAQAEEITAQSADTASVKSATAVSTEQNPNIAQPTKPVSSVSFGVGEITGDSRERSLFGQYKGYSDNNGYLLLDADVAGYDKDSGVWTTFKARDLGLDDKEMRFTQKKQGDWKYSVGYSELVRNYPRTINTGLQGAGTADPTVNLLAAPGTGSDLELKTTRRNVSLAAEKWLTPSLMFAASFKNEDKDGSRLFGKGYECPAVTPSGTDIAPMCTSGSTQWGILMLPEPIKSTTQQFEGVLNFAGERLALSGGYYGSFFTNAYGSLTPSVPGTLNNPLGAPTPLTAGILGILNLPVALPPDNQAHQFSLSGTYGFTPTTRATFKFAYTHATQHEDFASMGFTDGPPGVGNLGGVVDTTLAQIGLTARPMSKLSMLANVRYENTSDKTPLALYNTEGVYTSTNSQLPLQRLNGKLEASYVLPKNYRATLGTDYESVDYGDWAYTDVAGDMSALRQKTEELGWRAELRRSMFETLTGAIGYKSSRRNGSGWLQPNALPLTGVTPISDSAVYDPLGKFPLMFMDRTREKVTVSADWTPTDQLSLQFVVEDSQDDYSAPTTKGLRDSGAHLYSIDAIYTLSKQWKLTGYWSHSDQMIHIDHSIGYMAALQDRNDTLGLSVVGKPTRQLEVGADLSYLNDNNIYDQTLDPAASAANQAFLAANGLPDVTFRQTTLKLFGKYAMEKNADIRVDLLIQRTSLNEWTWGYNGVPFTYSDNTTVSLNPNQNVNFIGVTYAYKF